MTWTVQKRAGTQDTVLFDVERYGVARNGIFRVNIKLRVRLGKVLRLLRRV